MDSPSPHRLALFSLRPKNERAHAVVAHPANAHYRSTLPGGIQALDIGFHIRGRYSTTLAVLGRGVEADIYVEGSSIGKTQCSFEVDLNTGVVMLYDRSQRQSTQVFGNEATPFQHGRIRHVVVHQNFNKIIGMGGENRDLVRFELEWHRDLTESENTLVKLRDAAEERVENPRLAWTVDEAPTTMPSYYGTRLHTPGPGLQWIRYKIVRTLGAGQFGEVGKAVDVDSGRIMAVKVLKRPQASSQQVGWPDAVQRSLKREIETISTHSHPNIVDYVASQGWFDSDIEIFMGLKEGSLESLIVNGGSACAMEIANVALQHMLCALDFLTCKDIIHRDVKPENILYTRNSNGRYQFQLGDFGLCNRVLDAVSRSGTEVYMAPEVYNREQQSCKADVWSLLVTIIWTLNEDFRRTQFRCASQVYEIVSIMVSNNSSYASRLKEMGIVNPIQRASAAQMLVKLFNGEGLSTQRHRVPAFFTEPVAITVPTKPMANAPIPAIQYTDLKKARGKPKLSPKTKAPQNPAGIRKAR